MNIQETYGYLVRARQDLWSALEKLPDQVLSKPLLDGERFHCIKDLVFHIADVQDGWIHMDIVGDTPVQHGYPELRNVESGPVFAGFPLETLLAYWRDVDKSTTAYLATLSDEELGRVVIVEDWPGKRLTVDGLLWHVMIHEMRHTAQICMLLRLQDVKPPSLDLLFYLG